MPAEAWALFSAICFAGSHVVSKRGLQDTSVTAASLIVLSVSWLVISISVLFDPPAEVSGRALVVYGGLGLLVPGISRWAVLRSVDALGPSIAIPIQQGLRPLLSVGGAVLLLSEHVDLIHGIGVVAIIVGGWQLSKRPRETGPDAPAGVVTAGLFRPGIVFPLIAAVAYVASDLLVRATLADDLAEPNVAAMVSTGSGLAAWVLAVGLIGRMRSGVRFGRRAMWLVLAGALIGLAILGIYEALGRGGVSIVAPINATQPLIVLFLSALMLRDLERIHAVTVVSAVAIVAGAILVVT